ncbi:hypothetical protein DR950_17735 [Kitasatospora xanthocidica]|uniref:Uncharacterized protein n=1 Tax=Kitasatospora xanthocidica TaxID=83382 RepID=A0A372ZVZ8_9ACTN|nr:hypothetical protein [Kitasatospora xanthocidica]RGD59385.1 hypothetical protein DR950_17735 [Kitasatospora xanthocidica]
MTTTLQPTLPALLAADDRHRLAALLVQDYGLTPLGATYAASVTESAAHGAWESVGGEVPYSEWLASLPVPILVAALHLAAAACRDDTARHGTEAGAALLNSLADHLDH